VPIVVLGLAFQDFIETGARSLWLISGSLIVLALLLGVAEVVAARKERLRGEDEITFADAMAIGLGQSLALVPGVSRSGSTIMTGLFRGLSHAAAARFSFLLSIPAIFGSGMYELVAERDHLAGLGWGPILVAILVAFISGWASIWFLIRYLRTHTTGVFIWYRIALGIAMLVLLSRGILT
jgi:undecaprenyl-diphosphatase